MNNKVLEIINETAKDFVSKINDVTDLKNEIERISDLLGAKIMIEAIKFETEDKELIGFMEDMLNLTVKIGESLNKKEEEK